MIKNNKPHQNKGQESKISLGSQIIFMITNIFYIPGYTMCQASLNNLDSYTCVNHIIAGLIEYN